MRMLRRALLALVVLAVLYGGALVWLVANETRLVFVAGQPLGQLRPAAPFEEITAPDASGLRQLIWVMRSPNASAHPWLFFLHLSLIHI